MSNSVPSLRVGVVMNVESSNCISFSIIGKLNVLLRPSMFSLALFHCEHILCIGGRPGG